jgi:hypothetical protein
VTLGGEAFERFHNRCIVVRRFSAALDAIYPPRQPLWSTTSAAGVILIPALYAGLKARTTRAGECRNRETALEMRLSA